MKKLLFLFISVFLINCSILLSMENFSHKRLVPSKIIDTQKTKKTKSGTLYTFNFIDASNSSSPATILFNEYQLNFLPTLNNLVTDAHQQDSKVEEFNVYAAISQETLMIIKDSLTFFSNLHNYSQNLFQYNHDQLIDLLNAVHYLDFKELKELCLQHLVYRAFSQSDDFDAALAWLHSLPPVSELIEELNNVINITMVTSDDKLFSFKRAFIRKSPILQTLLRSIDDNKSLELKKQLPSASSTLLHFLQIIADASSNLSLLSNSDLETCDNALCTVLHNKSFSCIVNLLKIIDFFALDITIDFNYFKHVKLSLKTDRATLSLKKILLHYLITLLLEKIRENPLLFTKQSLQSLHLNREIKLALKNYLSRIIPSVIPDKLPAHSRQKRAQTFEFESQVSLIEFSPDERYAACGSTHLTLFDLYYNKKLIDIINYSSQNPFVLFNQSGNFLAYKRTDNTLALIDMAKPEEDWDIFQSNAQQVVGIFSPDGNYFTFPSSDTTFTFAQLQSGSLKSYIIPNLNQVITALAFNNDSSLLALASHDGQTNHFYLYKVSDNAHIEIINEVTPEKNTPKPIRSLSFFPNCPNNTVIAQTQNHIITVNFCDMRKNTRSKVFSENYQINSNKKLYAYVSKGEIHTFNISLPNDNQEKAFLWLNNYPKYTIPEGFTNNFSINALGSLLAANKKKGRAIVLYKVTKDDNCKVKKLKIDSENQPSILNFSKNSKFLAAAFDKKVTIYPIHYFSWARELPLLQALQQASKEKINH